MTPTTKGFQVTRMVRTMFAQFKNMVAMAIRVLCLQPATLADPFVALINKLFKPDPQVDWRATIPGKSYAWIFVKSECSHTLPYTALPYITFPDPINPPLASPHHKGKPCLTRPDPASPYSTGPHRTRPYLTQPILATERTHASPDQNLPCRAVPCLAGPTPASPFPATKVIYESRIL